jgi:hypothetical protein
MTAKVGTIVFWFYVFASTDTLLCIVGHTDPQPLVSDSVNNCQVWCHLFFIDDRPQPLSLPSVHSILFCVSLPVSMTAKFGTTVFWFYVFASTDTLLCIDGRTDPQSLYLPASTTAKFGATCSSSTTALTHSLCLCQCQCLPRLVPQYSGCTCLLLQTTHYVLH